MINAVVFFVSLLLVNFLFFLPGLLIFSMEIKVLSQFKREQFTGVKSAVTKLPGAAKISLISIISIIFYALICGVLEFLHFLHVKLVTDISLVFGLLFLFLLFLASIIRRQKGMGSVFRLIGGPLKEAKSVCRLYLAFVLFAAMIAFGTHDGLHNSLSHVGSDVTLWVIPSHDNQFQYFNALAIAHDEPFEKYYGNRRLVYEVNDREILPSIVYSILMRFFNGINQFFPQLGGFLGLYDSFTLYNFFAISLNATVLFPVYWLAGLLFPMLNPLLLTGLTTLNSFGLIHTYYAWFKLAAGGYFLSGLALLLSNLVSPFFWVLTGILWGIAANLHSSVVLGYPLVFIYLIFKFKKSRKTKSWLTPVGFFLAFFILYFPWYAGKKFFFHDTDVLIRQHLFYNYAPATIPYPGLLTTAREFFAVTPLKTQLIRRSCQLIKAMHLPVYVDLFHRLTTENPPASRWKEFLYHWTRRELSFVSVFFAPWLIGVLLIFARVRGIRNRPVFLSQFNKKRVFEIFLLSVSSFVLFVVTAFYGEKQLVDLTWHFPMGWTILGLLVVIGSALQLNTRLRWLMGVLSILLLFKFIFALSYYKSLPTRVVKDSYWECQPCLLDTYRCES